MKNERKHNFPLNIHPKNNFQVTHLCDSRTVFNNVGVREMGLMHLDVVLHYVSIFRTFFFCVVVLSDIEEVKYMYIFVWPRKVFLFCLLFRVMVRRKRIIQHGAWIKIYVAPMFSTINSKQVARNTSSRL